MQHEVFANPAPRTRAAFPYLAVLQADFAAEGRARIVAPMAPRASMATAAGRLLPIVRHAEEDYLLAVELMVSVPRTELRRSLGSIAAQRDDITKALDWLFNGV